MRLLNIRAFGALELDEAARYKRSETTTIFTTTVSGSTRVVTRITSVPDTSSILGVVTTSSSVSDISTTPGVVPTSSSLPGTSSIPGVVPASSSGSGPNPSTTSYSTTSYTNATTPIATPTSSTATAGHHNRTSSGLSGGAVAGIAIGTAIVGALVATAIILFMMGRKGRHRSSSSMHLPLSGKSSSAGGRRTIEAERTGGPSSEKPLPMVKMVNVENVLPQPLDDASVKQAVNALFSYIDGHVENFYHNNLTSRADQQQNVSAQSASFPIGIANQADLDVQQLLADPKYRFATMTAVVCASVLDAIDFTGPTEKSLLPAMITNFLRQSSAQVTDTHASRLSASRWRTSTCFLMDGRTSPEDKIHRDRAIELLIQDLDDHLEAYSIPEMARTRNEDLLALCKRAEGVGLMLLSQPAEWRFEWRWKARRQKARERDEPVQSAGRSLVVLPGLMRLTDNSAIRLDRPLVVLEPQVKY